MLFRIVSSVVRESTMYVIGWVFFLILGDKNKICNNAAICVYVLRVDEPNLKS